MSHFFLTLFLVMEYIDYGIFGLLLVSFLSATILPLTSEGILILFLVNDFDPYTCLIVASIGNILGSVLNYYIGTIIPFHRLEQKIKSKSRLDKFNSYIHNYGYWVAAIAWVPIIGDPLTILLGYYRVKFIPFLIILSLTKSLRYFILIQITLGLFF